MCGRYAIEYPEEFATRFGLNQLPPNLSPNYNAAPGQTLPVILKGNSSPNPSPTNKFDTNQLLLMQWGLIPHWAKDPKIGYQMINARAETVAQKPAYRQPFAHQRCLVPALGFYEWHKSPNQELKTDNPPYLPLGKGGDKSRPSKTPYYIHLKDNSLFSFAGLYDTWLDPQTNQHLYTFTIITTSPIDLLKPIHDRMPVILHPNEEQIWIDSETNTTQLLSLLETPTKLSLEAYPVSFQVNRPQNNSPELIRPIPLPQNQPLF